MAIGLVLEVWVMVPHGLHHHTTKVERGEGGVRMVKNEVLPKVAYCHPEGTRRCRGDVGVQWRDEGLIMGEYDHFLRTSFLPLPPPLHLGGGGGEGRGGP